MLLPLGQLASCRHFLIPSPTLNHTRHILHLPGDAVAGMALFAMPTPQCVNDVHSGLNPTTVSEIREPKTLEELTRTIAEQVPMSVSGCRHAMGGQQFVSGGRLIDIRSMNQVLDFDREHGLMRVEAGIQWPDLIRGYLDRQMDEGPQWGIAQKQTGADSFTIGGSIAANAHGRGLTMKPIVQDVESFTLLKADGQMMVCSRDENAELFSLVIGGYGLFGIVVDVTLRLVPRQKIERVVEIVDVESLDQRFAQRIADGYLYGDFQFSIDERSPDFLRKGVFSCYRPTDRPVPAAPQRHLEEENWIQLLSLAYTDRAAAYKMYCEYYLTTHGQVYHSDTHQLGPYLPDYSSRLVSMGAASAGSSLLITELYVPREKLNDFLVCAAKELIDRGMTVIYGTVRVIEQDDVTFLPWAKQRFACVIFNLLVEHTPEGIKRASDAFRALIDLACEREGSFYLTYHRYATTEQMKRAYPGFGEFMKRKLRHDPGEIFQSDWYRHWKSTNFHGI